jgi:hypothetical protein
MDDPDAPIAAPEATDIARREALGAIPGFKQES